MVFSKLKEKFGNHENKGDKKMKVAILGAGCYRTHAASGITNFSRACEVAEATGKENISIENENFPLIICLFRKKRLSLRAIKFKRYDSLIVE